ncbi:hypothetical protein QJS10_CPB18g00185 [Acorus calamus]|uniref:C2H2-type domain-containing protein n=1 Tax=Acorus calamus TaxID=4465 RepID=A0AAV9CJF1_ACOCL|nr:hypothetical protein QJS10_CPB18g00185 [Acorus calamus]
MESCFNALHMRGVPAFHVGEVTGWVVIDESSLHLNMKKRCSGEKHCGYIGNYSELQKHAKLKHPHARPSKIDPAWQLDWENFQ